ncbi:FAD-binding domain-containing protein [Dinoroseobacter sp. S124A]|uniref:FAD-binding domain-containing protein n=1 Tax=Dinoroseobacter sp. S124A TaxID=3415128 RepID=UPI003C7E4A62
MEARTLFPPSRDAALERLRDFLPKAGAEYARKRNYSLPEQGHPHVSILSPYLRHRMLTEEEVVQATLGRHSASAAEKFVQEVFWRTYWKGWLERRPQVWTAYKAGLAQALNRVQSESGLRRGWEEACAGRTGIDGFDAWAQELVQTGYMHNHARMWFASIWIFTLRLPWELGADFFLRHLLDGDQASNTLSWRWVAGLQTQGKHYVARVANISKYTEGRHRPLHQLTAEPEPLSGVPHPPLGPMPAPPPPRREAPWALLLTEDDLSPGYLRKALDHPPVATAVITGTAHRSPLATAPQVTEWCAAAIAETIARHGAWTGPVTQEPQDLAAWAQGLGVSQIVMPYTPVGPAADRLTAQRAGLDQAGIALTPVLRAWDAAAWPHATAGFFKLKTKIPTILAELRGLSLAS